MKTRWALLAIAIALALGIGIAWQQTRDVGAPMRMAIACVVLSEAGKAGYMDEAKRNTLLEKLATSAGLTGADREAAANLKSMCPKI